ncbi:MAG: hypothetical protein QXJ06_00800 [Candidatus Aenigmatarchaeota archaeon]
MENRINNSAKGNFSNSISLLIILIMIMTLFPKLNFTQPIIVQSSTEIKISDDYRLQVKEIYELALVGKETIDKYENIRKNTNVLSSWSSFLGDNFYLKIKSEYIDLNKLSINPSAYRDFTAFDETAYATIIIQYETYNSVFKKSKLKPRTYYYELNSSILNFKTTFEDQPYLSEKEYLKLEMPGNVKNLEVVPKNYELTNNTYYSWTPRQGALTNFKISFEKQISIYQEIEEYYKQKLSELETIISDKDFVYWILILVFLFISYILLKSKKLI